MSRPTVDELEARVREARTKIVAALNLSPLVPPQADTETLNIVNDAWIALSDYSTALTDLAARAREAEADVESLAARLRARGYSVSEILAHDRSTP